MAAALAGVEELIREYLLYKGFVQSLKVFDQERREDRDKGLRVNRIVDYILTAVNRSDFTALQSFWHHLGKICFSRLNHELKNTANKLESTILRLFLINAHRNQRHEEIKSFFERMAGALQDRRDWKDWFALPYVKNPEQHSLFKLYYSKEWYDAFVVSLYNFFSVMFSGLPLPGLLQFEGEHQRLQTSATENTLLHNQLATTKVALLEAENNIQNLEARLAQSVAHVSSVGRSQSVGKANKPIATVATKAAQRKGSVVREKSQERERRVEDLSKQRETLTYSPPEELRVSRESSEERTVPFSTEHATVGVDHTTPSKKNLNVKKEREDEDVQLSSKAIRSGGVSSAAPLFVVDQSVYKEHSAAITHCKFSPGGIHVASVDTTGMLRVWEPSSSQLATKSRINYSKTDLLSLDWVHHGGSDSLLLLGFSGCVVRLLDAESSLPLWEFGVDGKYPRIQSIVCSPSTSLFAISAMGALSQATPVFGSSRATVGLTSPTLPSQLAKPSEMLTMVKRVMPTSPSSVKFEPTPGELTIWDVNEQKIQSVLPLSPPTAINSMCFNHNGNLLVTGGVDGMIRMFDVNKGDCICGWTGHHGEVYNIGFSSDETTVYSMGGDGKFCQWSTLRTTERIAEFAIHKDATQPTRQWVESHSGYFPSTPPGNLFAFESEDKYVLTCSPDKGVIYQLGDGGALTHVLSLSKHKGPVTCVDWVPGRRSYSTCITGSADNTIRVTNLLKETNVL